MVAEPVKRWCKKIHLPGVMDLPGVMIEPILQTVTGETLTGASANTQDAAMLVVEANGFWGSTHERAYFDVKVFNLFKFFYFLKLTTSDRYYLPQ